MTDTETNEQESTPLIPNDLEKRKKLKELLSRAVSLKHEVDTLNEDLKAIKEDVEEDTGVTKANFAKLVKAAYEQDTQDKIDALDEIQQSLTILDNIEE